MTDEEIRNLPTMETSMGLHSLTQAERRKRVLRSEIEKQIDHILFTEWDPIGVHWISDDCADEYRAYVPKIVRMLQAGFPPSKISDYLWAIESDLFGDSGSRSRRRCDVIAVLVSRYGPEYSKSPFTPSVETATPEQAHHAVLDLVTQTRLDAFDGNWNNVCVGYERAIAICQVHLHDRGELLGTCLNNLGHACSQLGQLEKAQGYFDAALIKLAPEAVSDDALYLVCLGNLISNLEYRKLFDIATPYSVRRRAFIEKSFELDDNQTENSEPADFTHAVSNFVDGAAVQRELMCNRLPVERDGRVGPPDWLEIE